jgi:hypothetical protein
MSMRTNKEEYGSVEEVVSELCNVARNEYEIVLNLSKCIHKVKEVFLFALYKVTSLSSAPVASRVEDMPSDFRTSYLDAIDEANIAVDDLRKTTRDVLETYFNVNKTVSTATSEDVDLIGTCKRIKNDKDNESSGQGSTVGEVVKNKLKVVCDSYDKARLLLIREMQKYEKIMATIMTGAPCNEDEVLFSARGELVTASRAALISTTDRTYFDGLLNSGGWKSDIIGICILALKYDLTNSKYM